MWMFFKKNHDFDNNGDDGDGGRNYKMMLMLIGIVDGSYVASLKHNDAQQLFLALN